MSPFRTLCLFLVLLLAVLPVTAMDLAPVTSPTLQPVRVIIVPVTTVTTAAMGAISLASVPSGATVSIDGSVMGTTPYTIRTLSAGTHSLILQLAGYQEYSATFTITAGGLNQQTYTLVPLTTVTTSPPGISVLTATMTTTPAPTTPAGAVVTATAPVPLPTPTPGQTPVPVQTSSFPFNFPQPVRIQPLAITIGSHTKSPVLSTLSPYFSAQLSGTGSTSGAFSQASALTNIPTSYIEVDSRNVYLPQSHLMSGAEMALDPVWGDEDSVPIATTDKYFNNTNFRWISALGGQKGFYQISRYPFDSDASHWQNQYVPGLVSSGPIKDVYVDSDGFHYFSINFAPIANHNPSDPPFYTGVAELDQTVPGKGMSMGMVRIPGTGIGIYVRSIHAGPVAFPFPAGLATLAPNDLTESDLGNPNQNQLLSSADLVSSRALTGTEQALLTVPQTYYVRVVPINNDGSAGVPTLPVTVTAVRPKPCPPNPPSNSENDLLVKPPSATVESFYMTSFVPDWIRTDQNGKLVARAHFVTVTSPPYCPNTSGQTAQGNGLLPGNLGGAASNSMISGLDASLCAAYGGSQPGYHFYADPAESHWYDTVWDIITGLFAAWAQVIHAVSVAWTAIQNTVVILTAYAIQGLTGYDCNSSPACLDLLHTGLSIAESSLGIPPTVPDVADLENMGADYMAKVAAEEVGAGGVVDTAQNVYGSIPGSVTQNAGAVGQGLAQSVSSQSGNAIATQAGSFYIPDPLYYQAHPATVIVRVNNPNNVPTDAVTMTVSDSSGLYKVANKYVPALAPHDTTVIPVILEEDYSKVYTPTCSADAYTTTCDGSGNCVPCYWNLWYFAVIQSSNNGGDTFSASFSTTKNGFFTDLTPTSSGKVLASQNIMTFDDQGKSCGAYNAKTVLTYPAGWQMQTNTLTQDLWSLCWLKYTFTEGDKGRLISG